MPPAVALDTTPGHGDFNVRYSCPKVPSVKRCLFGPVDHGQTKKVLLQQMDSMQDQRATQWNFDFDQERPLEGRFEWSAIAAPESHRTCYTPVAIHRKLRHHESPFSTGVCSQNTPDSLSFDSAKLLARKYRDCCQISTSKLSHRSVERTPSPVTVQKDNIRHKRKYEEEMPNSTSNSVSTTKRRRQSIITGKYTIQYF